MDGVDTDCDEGVDLDGEKVFGAPGDPRRELGVQLAVPAPPRVIGTLHDNRLARRRGARRRARARFARHPRARRRLWRRERVLVWRSMTCPARGRASTSRPTDAIPTQTLGWHPTRPAESATADPNSTRKRTRGVDQRRESPIIVARRRRRRPSRRLASTCVSRPNRPRPRKSKRRATTPSRANAPREVSHQRVIAVAAEVRVGMAEHYTSASSVGEGDGRGVGVGAAARGRGGGR